MTARVTRQTPSVALSLCRLTYLAPAPLAPLPPPYPVDPTAQPAKPQIAICMRSEFATLLEVALALRHMHSLHVVHRDVSGAAD